MAVTLYPKNRSAALDAARFRHPAREYRGAPFWSWNNKLDVPQLLRQLGHLKEMGLGGATLHCRTGLDTEYLGGEFMEAVKASVEHARKTDMLVWLYDEDRWPSGFAGGLVTRDPQYRSKHLLFTATPYSGVTTPVTQTSHSGSSRNEKGVLLARYEVVLDAKGCLASYTRLLPDAAPSGKGRVWYAYLETAEPNAWFNHQGYVDTLSPAAIRRFVEVTHEAYKAAVGADFGGLIPAMFTDEPQFAHKQCFRGPSDLSDVCLPWTTDIVASFQAAYGFDLLDRLPEVYWELPGGGASVARYRYHDHIAERFSAAFADTCGDWCSANNIMLTGHMMNEPTLHSQTISLGEAMRSYRSFHLPGIDMLCDWREFTTAKQAQSACHQYGRPGVLSELYGVTNWDFTFTGHKGQGDWQAALGVTVRVHHLNWVSMKGEAKRDYPAAIGYQSPWYREYPLVEDHFARLNVALTRGRPLVRVGVIHPIESYWLCAGPTSQTAAEREERESAFSNVTNWLLFGLIDFDFICESLLPSQGGAAANKQLQVGEMAYDVIVVPPMRTIRATTLARLEAFAAAGGEIIFAGEVPSLVDAVPSQRAEALAERCTRVAFARLRLLDALAPYRLLSLAHHNGTPASTFVHQLRRDGDRRHLFICNTDRVNGQYFCPLTLAGRWAVESLDTFTGEVTALPAELSENTTTIKHNFDGCSHLLLTLTPAPELANSLPAQSPTTHAAPAEKAWRELPAHLGQVRVTLEEPNVLLLDQAEWRFAGDSAWQPLEEILRLDNLVRRRLGLRDRSGEVAQPWTDTAAAPTLATVELRFTINTKAAVAAPQLALEDAEITTITVDGRSVPTTPKGYYVDESITTVDLPPLTAGEHQVILSRPFTRKSELEWSYLLGDFSVRTHGRYAILEAPVREIGFGDTARQGFAFYGGNLTYHLPLYLEAPAEVQVEIPRFAAPLISISVNGGKSAPIAFPPHRLNLGTLTAGQHTVALTAFGNRMNTFGAIHCYQPEREWWGPDAWRTNAHNWGYEYHLKPTGILTTPRIHVR